MTAANTAIFDTNVLVGLVPNLKLSQSWLLDRFFRNMVESDTEYVSIDVDVGKRRMAPFCSPLVEGKMVESRRYQTNIFKPAYIKDKRVPDLRKPVRRMMGERIGGEMSAGERDLANLQFEMADQVDILRRRLEWMAASALKAGAVTIAGEGFPTTLIDFGRDTALTIALSGGAAWDAVTPITNPTAYLDQWQNIVLKKSGGVCTDIVFTTTSWTNFLRDPILKQAGWFPGQGGPNIQTNLGAEIQRGAVSKGQWGQYNLWLYNDWYVDDVTNVETPMLPDGSLVMCGPDLMGTQAFGAILDPEFGYGRMAYAPKSWTQKDPAQRFLMMQSSPIVIPSRVNACLFAQVATAVMS